MADEIKIYSKEESLEMSNKSSHYILIVLAVAVGFGGVVLRFFGESATLNFVADTLFIIGIVIGFKAVFDILK